MHRRFALLVILASALAALVLACSSGCDDGANPASRRAAGAKPRVFAPNQPLASFVRELAGDAVELVTPWTGAPDPAYWKPTADAIREIQSCDLILLNGAGHEPWADQAALPRARTVDTTAGVKDKLIAVAGETHSHGPAGAHTHSSIASTTWLSPALARAQADAIAAALERLLATPDARAALAARKTALVATFARTEKALAELKTLEPRWLASHPVYQYLAQASGIELASVHWEPGEMPDDKEWTKFRVTRAAFPKPTAWMLWEGEPGPEIRARLEKEGVRVAVVPPAPGADGEFAGSYALLVERLCDELRRR